MPRIAGDVPYRLMGAGQPTLACSRDALVSANPQSEDHHCSSIIFNGVGDGARLPSDQDLGITNAFTVNLWVNGSNLDNNSLTQTLFQIHKLDSGDNDNAFDITIDPDGSGFDKLNFRLFSLSGTLIQRYEADADDFFGDNDLWCMITCTWDGTVLTMYRNGENNAAAMTTITDIAGDQANTTRSMSIGTKVDFSDFFAGRFHQVALWSKVLTENEIRTIWNHGSGSRVNIQIGHDSYDGQDDLEAWYKLGRDPIAPAADYSGNGHNMAEFVVEETLPTGMIVPFGGSSAPAGFLLCDGAAISRATFASLFAVIDTNYGIGDGSTTFNVPDMQGRNATGLDGGDVDFDALGESGGAKEVDFTLEADQLPVHFHLLAGASGDDNNSLNNRGPVGGDDGGGGNFTDPDSGYNSGVRENNGDGTSVTAEESVNVATVSPYLVVNYIIQT